MNPLDAGSYAAFATALRESDCRKCDLADGRTNIVVDRGNPKARLMAIGEGPGAEEDATGRAFVGRSGRLLDRLFGEAGIDPETDVLIANIVRCRPPDNRAPKASEAKACLPYLRHQIGLVSPKVIALLGASAARFLLPALKGRAMRDVVGRFRTDDAFPGVTFLPLYHPAFLLRDPRKVPEMKGWLDDLAAAIRSGGPDRL
jgi:DNA polymerase